MALGILQGGHAAAGKAEHLARLAALWNAEQDVPAQRRYFHLTSQDGRRKIDPDVGVEVIPLAFEALVGGNLDHKIQISRPIGSRFSLTCKANFGAGFGAGRDSHL